MLLGGYVYWQGHERADRPLAEVIRENNVLHQLDIILQGYRLASIEVSADDTARRRRVGSSPQSDAERQIREALPKLISTEIAATGRDLASYRVYGSVGQINFPFARIPWVAALHREVTTSTERGYYIVLLFREDLQGCALSLNQGYTQYRAAFGTSSLAAEKVRESASVALSYLDLPEHFVTGPIDLGATGSLGFGYERGAIASAIYGKAEEISAAKFSADFATLLNAYDILRRRLGPNIVDAASPPSEDDFQEAATILSKPSTKDPYIPLPPGPVPPVAKSPRSRGSGFKRDPRVSGAAILGAGYRCEVDPTHMSFVARATKQNYVEAHHLIPMQFQERFSAGLDVLENIVALCPTCHRMLHHGRLGEKSKIIQYLHTSRASTLSSRGLDVSSEHLLSLYRSSLEED